MKKLLHLLGVVIFLSSGLLAQYNPQFQVDITATENFNHHYDYFQFLVHFDTQSEISAGNMNADGSDIRFGDACGSKFYEYWIESGINTAHTRIWIMVPNVNANDVINVSMFYGDSTANPQSSFSATFPNAILSSGTVTLSGDTTVGWLQITSGNSLQLAGGTPVNIYAAHVDIAGAVNGDGMGYAAALTPGPTTGGGTGGGTASSNSGAGGGSYGGVGGTGGFDSGDSPGNGGPTYGSRKTMAIDMGSAGGTSSTIQGGNGGGAVAFYAQEIKLSGTISVNGNGGTQPGGGQGGGGGAGGGALLVADSIIFSGTINAEGGNGSVGTIAANDDGGGGGGGRVKLFSSAGIINSGTISVEGGDGGPNGTASGGEDGEDGTTIDTSFSYSIPTLGAAGSATIIDRMISYNGSSLSSNTTNATYQWLDCSSTPPVAIPNETNQTLTLTGNGSFSVMISNGGCTDTSDCFAVNDFGIPEDPLNMVRFFPNPASNILSFELPADQNQVELMIFDQKGKTLLKSRITGEKNSIDVSQLPSGVYYIELKDGLNGIHHPFVKL